MPFLAVGIGGAIGALLRAGVIMLPIPIPIFIINCIGSFFLALLLTHKAIQNTCWKLLLTTGLLGSFTTFSTFSAETLQYLQQGEIMPALLYSGGTLIVGLICSFFGFKLGGGVWR